MHVKLRWMTCSLSNCTRMYAEGMRDGMNETTPCFPGVTCSSWDDERTFAGASTGAPAELVILHAWQTLGTRLCLSHTTMAMDMSL